jgi:ABC-type antimicrobial peptide transport system permease subunit
MNKIINGNFVKMSKQGITGAFFGIIAGLLLGILIYLLQFPLIWISQIGNSYQSMGGNWSGMMFISAVQPGTLGMSFGAIIGAIFGSIDALKNQRNG